MSPPNEEELSNVNILTKSLEPQLQLPLLTFPLHVLPITTPTLPAATPQDTIH